MKKTIIRVPKGIRYINEWEGFLDIFPKFPHIMDKTITGCGFTEWCITNSVNVILCSPRNILLDNKAEQHSKEVYRLRSPYYDIEPDVDKDTTRSKLPSDNLENEEEELEQLKKDKLDEDLSSYDRVSAEFDEYTLIRGTLPRKILVTYDSFHIIKDVLKNRGSLSTYYIIVDESQSIFTDARFKSNTELDFVDQLQDLQKVCYLSATPMMDEYLEHIPEFSNLPYYELDWKTLDEGRVCQPNLIVKMVRSIYEPAKREIERYKFGQYEKFYKIDDGGEVYTIESKELIFYVNSVNNIVQIISKCGLKPEECNILCAKTRKNDKFIKNKLGKNWNIGKVPIKGEQRKMFTFCTRTVYLGADFYSDNARSVILSDANIECLAVDISLDLPQILGRQRLWENPWKTSAEFFYKPLTDKTKKKISPEEFKKHIDKKLDWTRKKLRNWELAEYKDVATSEIKKVINSENYKEDYVGVSKRGGKPTINNLVFIAEQRAFDIQQIDYKDRFSVMNAMDINCDGALGEVNAFFYRYDNLVNVYDKLKWLCEAELSEEARRIVEDRVENKMKSYLALGKDRLRALGYHSAKINRELGIKTFNNDILDEKIYEEFKEGDKIPKMIIKEKLEKIFTDIGFDKTPKAQSIEEWFMVRRYQLRKDDGKRLECFELIKKKRA